MTAPVVRGALTWRSGDGPSFLTPAGATWALDRLWALVAGGAEWPGAPAFEFVGATPANVSGWLGAAPGSWERVATSRGPLPAPSGSDAGPVGFDLVSFLFLMLSRWEEREGARDTRDRSPAADSLALRQGFLDLPIVDEWALEVRARLERAHPEWRAARSRARLFLTHDVDVVRRFGSVRGIAQGVAGRLRRGQLRGLAADARAWRSWPDDPYLRGLDRLMDASERHGLRSAFYFKTARRGPQDSGYRLTDPPGAAALGRVRSRGHEVGFHPGFDSYLSPAILAGEWAGLTAAVGETIRGGRQHHLRFRAPDTWRHWNDLGLAYDSTLGYSERAGFRCGTCHPYPVFDFVADRPLALVERPLIVMDTTLRSAAYEGLGAEAARARTLALAARCHRVGGEFVLLWHNSSFSGQYEGWADIYEPLVADLVATLGAA